MAGKSRIKGITIELDGEVTGLEKAMKDVTSKSIDLQGELRDVERLLKFDPGNVEALAQKQEILTRQIENTTEKLNRLKSAEEEVERQFQSGDIGEKQYRSFRREIEFTEKSIKDLKSKMSQLDGAEVKQLKSDFNKVEESSDEASDSVKDLGNELVNLAAGAGAVAGLGELIEKSLDVSSLNTKIDISFDVPEESIGSVKEATNAVISYGIDAEEALAGVRRQWALNKGYSDEEKISMTKYAAAISKAYDGIDFNELIQESYELASSLELDNNEALGMINSLLKVGFPPDQLDIITEYGSQLSRAGYSAEEIQAIMKAGVDTGSWNIDNLLDGLKEGRIVLSEFGQGIDEETAKLFNKIGISSKQVQEWGQAVAAGGKSGKDAMVEVAKAISNIDDSTLQNQIGVKVYGTLWEEQGNAIVNTIVRADDEVISLEKNQEGLNNTISSMDSDPAIKMEKAMTDLKNALQPILTIIAEVVGKVAEWISNNPTLAATITAVITVIGILMGIFMALSPIITAITALAGTLGVSIGAIAYPVLIVIGVITALIAIGVALYKNWDEIKTKCSEIWTSIKDFFSNIVDRIKTSVVEKFNNIKESISNKMHEVKTSISDIWNKVMDFFKDIDLFEIGANIIQGLINGVKSMASSIVNSVKGVVDGAIEGAKNLLGIHSPSRVFMEFGEYTGEGFINGINEMKNAVAKAGQDMADASIPNIKQPKFKSLEGKSEEVGDIILYVTNNTNLDSKLIATKTTPKVIRNVTRSTTNYKRGLGGVQNG
ncbi:phage tail tape measure protein [Clostridium paraputrificum]|uniref:phage tail tape measure protein n=1 Tax=Clostridium paraputrificum TaxID=29363 RepID=UPI000DCFD8A9|nr:phage tail tape measure protein [Clostridium paraputrificum]